MAGDGSFTLRYYPMDSHDDLGNFVPRTDSPLTIGITLWARNSTGDLSDQPTMLLADGTPTGILGTLTAAVDGPDPSTFFADAVTFDPSGMSPSGPDFLDIGVRLTISSSPTSVREVMGLDDLFINPDFNNAFVYLTGDQAGLKYDHDDNVWRAASVGIDPNMDRAFGVFEILHPDSSGELVVLASIRFEGGLRYPIPDPYSWATGVIPAGEAVGSFRTTFFPALLAVLKGGGFPSSILDPRGPQSLGPGGDDGGDGGGDDGGDGGPPWEEPQQDGLAIRFFPVGFEFGDSENAFIGIGSWLMPSSRAYSDETMVNTYSDGSERTSSVVYDPTPGDWDDYDRDLYVTTFWFPVDSPVVGRFSQCTIALTTPDGELVEVGPGMPPLEVFIGGLGYQHVYNEVDNSWHTDGDFAGVIEIGLWSNAEFLPMTVFRARGSAFAAGGASLWNSPSLPKPTGTVFLEEGTGILKATLQFAPTPAGSDWTDFKKTKETVGE